MSYQPDLRQSLEANEEDIETIQASIPSFLQFFHHVVNEGMNSNLDESFNTYLLILLLKVM